MGRCDAQLQCVMGRKLLSFLSSWFYALTTLNVPSWQNDIQCRPNRMHLMIFYLHIAFSDNLRVSLSCISNSEWYFKRTEFVWPHLDRIISIIMICRKYIVGWIICQRLKPVLWCSRQWLDKATRTWGPPGIIKYRKPRFMNLEWPNFRMIGLSNFGAKL